MSILGLLFLWGKSQRPAVILSYLAVIFHQLIVNLMLKLFTVFTVMGALGGMDSEPLELLCFFPVLSHTETRALALRFISSLLISPFYLFLFFKTCSESVKAKAAKSDWLRDLFLPNIMLFTDKRYFNDKEWDRLEHFAPPYGFMELNYSRESLGAHQDGIPKPPTGTGCQIAAGWQDLPVRGIRLGRSYGGNCGGFPGSIPEALDANSSPCLLHSGERGHDIAAPTAPPAAAPGQQQQKRVNVH